jgi:hypothetical protein
MKFIDLIAHNKLDEAKELIESYLNSIIAKRIEEKKRYVACSIYEEVEELEEANIIRMGRIQKIRRRIRRNAKGRITVQKNVRRSAIKGYKLSGNTVKRIPASVRIHKARMLKRYWKSKGRAKLNRTLLKRKMSLRRRKSMGIR